MKIGAIAESFNKPYKEAIESIAALKLDGVQMYADTKIVHVGMMVKDIKEVKKIIDGEMDEYPEAAFLNAGTIDDVIEKAKQLENE